MKFPYKKTSKVTFLTFKYMENKENLLPKKFVAGVVLDGCSRHRKRVQTEQPEEAETALGCTAHTRLAQRLLKSVSGWVGVHVTVWVRTCVYMQIRCVSVF